MPVMIIELNYFMKSVSRIANLYKMTPPVWLGQGVKVNNVFHHNANLFPFALASILTDFPTQLWHHHSWWCGRCYMSSKVAWELPSLTLVFLPCPTQISSTFGFPAGKVRSVRSHRKVRILLNQKCSRLVFWVITGQSWETISEQGLRDESSVQLLGIVPAEQVSPFGHMKKCTFSHKALENVRVARYIS